MLDDLHRQYGPIVRTGPCDLSIAHPQGVRLIYGPQSPCTKNAFYDMSYPAQSLLSFREKPLHDRRRRVWSPGFSEKALRGYEKRIRVYRQKLFDQLMAREGETVNAIQWFNFYAYDVMGDLAFARSFDMLDDNENHWAIQVLLDGLGPLEYMIPVWLLRLFLGIAMLSKDWWQFGKFCNDRLMHRLKNTPDIPDISASLLAPVDCDNLSSNDIGTLGADTRLILTAGSDTSAIALTMILYELAQHPDEAQKLRNELAPYTPDENGEYSHDQISQLMRLNGFINETLRLHPPIPGVIPRKTPPEGMKLGDTFIPGNINVSCPQWVLGRSTDVYVDPEKFTPERWFEKPELIKEKSAFAPFTIGSYACIGKSLALMNLRTTTARMIMTFDIQFPPGVEGPSLLDNSREHFSLSIEHMPILLTRRQE
ncbi:hypothetical protein N7520_008520 [Penicillium odoratum]|uniref:uncharacterized protein n=1 Tax=Penicillium odoratum TaxID=1167516 RepID=UPI002546908A|nr:uncharacterized protein N7520_008520 [Penicillium odoratum]KAJ5751603.1 hypothetical protein N7520_008520 [Penicillium odoratum]